ncbi:hypothetical protein D3C86_2037300 [compost metagenome]
MAATMALSSEIWVRPISWTSASGSLPDLSISPTRDFAILPLMTSASISSTSLRSWAGFTGSSARASLLELR